MSALSRVAEQPEIRRPSLCSLRHPIAGAGCSAAMAVAKRRYFPRSASTLHQSRVEELGIAYVTFAPSSLEEGNAFRQRRRQLQQFQRSPAPQLRVSCESVTLSAARCLRN